MFRLPILLTALLLAAVPAANATIVHSPNSIGIYTTAWATSSEIHQPPLFTPIDIYFVLHDPRTASGAAVPAIEGFEFLVRIAGPAGNLVRSSQNLPSAAINVGNASNPYYATYIVSMGQPRPVNGGQVMLMSWSIFMVNAGAPLMFYLEPSSPASVPNRLAFTYRDGASSVRVGAYGTQPRFSLPQFAIGTSLNPPVAVESAAFGAVKALFR
jgi:hypothetical protein